MYTRLEGSPWADAVARAVAANLESSEPGVRARAIQFFLHVDIPLGAQRAAALLEGDRKLFAGVPDPVTTIKADKTLEESLWRVAAPLVKTPGRVRDMARAEALAPGKGKEAVYTALAQFDPEWLSEHAEEVLRATPALGKDLILIVTACFPVKVPKKPVIDRLRALLT
jgi:hypothetical protein